MDCSFKSKTSEILHNILIGLMVSIVMLNLGAALGILSGRGAFAGMLSAGLIALITSLFGGTRIQGSGTTAPMSTVTALIVAYAAEQLPTEVPGMDPNHFITLTLLLTGIFMIVFALLRLGRFIAFVPNLVISGFMCGIAAIIWVLQFDLLIGFDGTPIEGSMSLNILIAFGTILIASLTPILLQKLSQRLSNFVPATLIALLVMSFIASYFSLPVGFLSVENPIHGLNDFKQLIIDQIPTTISLQAMILALPFALKLAALCYIDTLLTSLIIDKMRDEKTKQNQELAAQGIATTFVSLVGGIPGAQSTVPSVLTVKEGATMRLAGISAGIFVILEMLLLTDFMGYIPEAVFAGILIKVGYDVFDFKPLWAYLRTLKRKKEKRPTRIIRNREMSIITGTTFTTAFIDLIFAVGSFTFLYHLINYFKKGKKEDKKKEAKKINDYVPK